MTRWNVGNDNGKAIFRKTTFGGFNTQREALEFHKRSSVNANRSSLKEINDLLGSVSSHKDWLVKLAELETKIRKPRTKKT